DQPHPLGDAHLIAMGHALILHRFLDTYRVDDKHIAFPASDGAAVIAGRHFVDLELRLIHVDAPHFAEGFCDDSYLLWSLDNFDRVHRNGHHGGHAIWDAG